MSKQHKDIKLKDNFGSATLLGVLLGGSAFMMDTMVREDARADADMRADIIRRSVSKELRIPQSAETALNGYKSCVQENFIPLETKSYYLDSYARMFDFVPVVSTVLWGKSQAYILKADERMEDCTEQLRNAFKTKRPPAP